MAVKEKSVHAVQSEEFDDESLDAFAAVYGAKRGNRRDRGQGRGNRGRGQFGRGQFGRGQYGQGQYGRGQPGRGRWQRGRGSQRGNYSQYGDGGQETGQCQYRGTVHPPLSVQHMVGCATDATR